MFLDVVNRSNLPREPKIILGERVEENGNMFLAVAVLLPVFTDPPLSRELADRFVSPTANLRFETEGKIWHLRVLGLGEYRLRVYSNHSPSHGCEERTRVAPSTDREWVTADSDLKILAPEREGIILFANWLVHYSCPS
jgi:hypothetical protein